MNAYKIIDENNWARATHCKIFRNYVEPAFCVTVEVNVENFFVQVKKYDLSFTLSMVYAVCKCANEIENFRYRFLNGQIVLFEKIDTAFTWLDADSELFKVVNVPMCDNLVNYVEVAKQAIKNQREYFVAPLGNDVFQCSALPFLTYSHISHTISGNKDNATPLFDWGKYRAVEDKLLMPLSVQAHHSFVDGLHIGRFADKLQNYLDSKIV